MPGSQRYKHPKSIAKLNLSYQVKSHGSSTFKKRGHKTGVFPVLQNLTHMCISIVAIYNIYICTNIMIESTYLQNIIGTLSVMYYHWYVCLFICLLGQSRALTIFLWSNFLFPYFTLIRAFGCYWLSQRGAKGYTMEIIHYIKCASN